MHLPLDVYLGILLPLARDYVLERPSDIVGLICAFPEAQRHLERILFDTVRLWSENSLLGFRALVQRRIGQENFPRVRALSVAYEGVGSEGLDAFVTLARCLRIRS